MSYTTNPPFATSFTIAILLSASFANCRAEEPQCSPFREIYTDGADLCNTMFGDSFETVDDEQGYTMWFFDENNPNDDVTSALGLTPPDVCHLEYFHKEAPSPEPAGFAECHPWKENACCHSDTVSTAAKIRNSYGAEYAWDRCGPLSPACERFFVQEACFYECEPNAGLFRRYPGGSNFNESAGHNSWEIHRMPIKRSYCNAWYNACYDDLFCAADDGDFWSCAKVYKVHDQTQNVTVNITVLQVVTEEAVPNGIKVLLACLAVIILVALFAVYFYVQQAKKAEPQMELFDNTAELDGK